MHTPWFAKARAFSEAASRLLQLMRACGQYQHTAASKQIRLATPSIGIVFFPASNLTSTATQSHTICKEGSNNCEDNNLHNTSA
jgi:hypothetical protein